MELNSENVLTMISTMLCHESGGFLLMVSVLAVKLLTPFYNYTSARSLHLLSKLFFSRDAIVWLLGRFPE